MPIAQVAALQIIQYSKQRQLRHTLQAQDNLSQIKTQHGCGKEYEINVVFRSGNRVNIISHRNRRAILEDCSALAAFLDVPIWHKNQ